MPAVILAGGLGTRLRPAVADRPKVLAPVNGRPFLAWLLDQLEAAGIRRAVLCTGHMGYMVQETFGTSYGRLELAYSQEESPLGTGGALRLAMPLLDAEAVLVLNGDSYCQTNLTAFLGRHLASGVLASLLLVKVPDASRFGRVQAADDGRVTAFVEKDCVVGPGWINAGVYLLATRLLEQLPLRQTLSLERDLMPAWLELGVMSFPCQGQFLDIGTPESYGHAEVFFGEVERSKHLSDS